MNAAPIPTRCWPSSSARRRARSAAGWALEETGLALQQDLHGVWLDPDGGVWVAGGQTASFPLTDGVLVHKGDPIAAGGI